MTPKPQTPNPKTETRNPKPETQTCVGVITTDGVEHIDAVLDKLVCRNLV